MPKKLAFSLALLLAVFFALPAAADGEYRSEKHGFTVVLPDGLEEKILMVEIDSGVELHYLPAMHDGWGGQLCVIAAASPRSAWFSDDWGDTPRHILAMSRDSVYYLVYPRGGVDSGPDTLEEYKAASKAMREVYIISDKPADSIPLLNPAAAPELSGDAVLTRGEAAEIVFDMLEAENKSLPLPSPFSDVPDGSAAAYLASYGIVSGYPDGSFRPGETLTRAELCVLMHRAQFNPWPWWYGEAIDFPDVSESHWAWSYLNLACQNGWLSPDVDGLLRPDDGVTAGEAAQILSAIAK